MTWAEYLRTWGQEWQAKLDLVTRESSAAIEHAIAAGGTQIAYYRASALEFIENLKQVEVDLRAMATVLTTYTGPDRDAWVKLLNQYIGIHRNLTAGVMQGATLAPEPAAAPSVQGREFGIAPAAAVVVGGLTLSVSAVAFSVAFLPYSQSLREQVALHRADLDARVAASKEGRSLAPSTLPPAPDEGPSTTVILASVGVLLTTAAAGYVVFAHNRR